MGPLKHHSKGLKTVTIVTAIILTYPNSTYVIDYFGSGFRINFILSTHVQIWNL